MTKRVRLYSPDKIARIGFVDKTKEPFIDIICEDISVTDVE